MYFYVNGKKVKYQEKYKPPLPPQKQTDQVDKNKYADLDRKCSPFLLWGSVTIFAIMVIWLIYSVLNKKNKKFGYHFYK